MSELGRLLIEARAGNNVTLIDAEDATRIPRRYLEALECGNYAAFHRGATGRGFLRNYAQYLGLDADETVRLYMAESGDPGPERLQAEDGQGRPVDYRPLEVELGHVPPRNWWSWAIALAAVALLAGGGWALLGRGFDLSSIGDGKLLAALGPQPAMTATVTATATRWVVRVTPTAPVAPVAIKGQAVPTSDLLPYPTPTVPSTITPTVRPTRTPEVTTTTTITTGILAVARITQRSWVRIVADGDVIEEGVLEPGVERNWGASQVLNIRTGNAAGVDLTMNNQNLGTMGAVGQVLDTTYVLQDGQVVEATDIPAQPAAPSADTTPTPAG